jgi:hypothetical protein
MRHALRDIGREASMRAETTAREEILIALDVHNCYGQVILQTVWALGRERHPGSRTRTDTETITSPLVLDRRLAELAPLLWRAALTPLPAVRSAA